MREVSNRDFDNELVVVAALRRVGAQLEATGGPDSAERERMRQRVMAEFCSVVHDGTSPVLPLAGPRRTARTRRWLPDETRGRVVVSAAATLCLLMSLSGMSVLLSRDALPGDALYTFKRSAESAELGLTFGDQPKALKHLEFAGARVSEIEMMAEQADSDGTWSDGQEKFLRLFDDFDADATAGARLLATLASHGQTTNLAALRAWAQQQGSRLQAVRTALPLPASARVESTLALLNRVVLRSSALDRRSDCTTVTSDIRDDLGLLPAGEACIRVPVGTSSTVPLPGSGAAPGTPAETIAPGLLGSSAATPAPVATQPDQSGRPGLPGAPDPRGVIPAPGQPGTHPSRPLPGNGSPSPAIPLPWPGIPLPELQPPA